MTIFILRASHANEYELQNYYSLAKKHHLHLVTSLHPLTETRLKTHKLWSPTDLPNFPLRKQIFNRLLGGGQWLIGLNQLIKSNGLSHVILHTAETYTPYTHQAVQLRKRGVISKLICTCWETIPNNNEKFARLRQWKKEAYQYVDVFHTPTQRAKQTLISEGVPASKIKVIPYGLDLSRFHSKIISKSPKTHKPVVLTLSRRVPEKGYQIWQQLSRELSGVADFRWISDAPYSRIPQLLDSADIFFLPSQVTPTWEEQYGMVLVEAMAAGLPIVTTTSGAIPEVVGNVALLSSPTDIQLLHNNLLRLITDFKLRARCSRHSLARARSHFNSLDFARKIASFAY